MRAVLFVCLFVCFPCFGADAATDRFTYTKTDAIRSHDPSQVANLANLLSGTSCHVCYGDSQCWNADSMFARCEYLAETTKILNEDDVEEDEEGQGMGARIEVNDALSFLMSKAAVDEQYQECIPHVSQYTNCHKGNICLGCKRCSCSKEGTWNCRQIQQCRSSRIKLEIKDEILNLAIEKLNMMHSNELESRKKRSFPTRSRKPQDSLLNSDKPKPLRLTLATVDPTTTTQPKTTFQLQNSWNFHNLSHQSTLNPKMSNLRAGSFLEKESGLQHMTDDLFKEIKKNLSVSSETNAVSKTEDFNFDDLIHDESNDSHKVRYYTVLDGTSSTTTNPVKKMYNVGDLIKMVNMIYNANAINGGETTFEKRHNNEMDTVTKENIHNVLTTVPVPTAHLAEKPKKYETKAQRQVILGKAHGKNTRNLNHKTLMDWNGPWNDYSDLNVYGEVFDKTNVNNNLLNETDPTDYTDFEELNSVVVMKRNVNSVTNSYDSKNSSQTLHNLNDDVLQPLNNIIFEKQNEINDLKKVREKILDYLRSYINANYTLNSNKTEFIEESKEFSIYQLAINHQSAEDNSKLNYQNFRRSDTRINQTKTNQTQTSKYLHKLRRDIYEVLKDVIAIKRETNNEESHELKLLTRALKFYFRSQVKKYSKFSQDKELLHWWNTQEKTRRLDSNQQPHYVLDALVNIFQILEKTTLQGSALQALSPNTRKVIKRIISDLVNKYSTESDNWVSINDPHYNITEDLASFRERINRSLADIKNASVFDIIDNMKTLHLVLTADANKMRKTLFLFEKNKNRRIQDHMDECFEEALGMIKKDVDLTKDYISRMFVDINTYSYLNGFGKSRPKVGVVTKKESFMRYLKQILGKSKKNILGIIHRTTPPKDKHLELMTLNRLMEYEKIMKKWQNDLEVIPKRKKRFIRRNVNDIRSNLKSILPKYLRRKVGPGIIVKAKANRRRYYVGRDETYNSRLDNFYDKSNNKPKSLKISDASQAPRKDGAKRAHQNSKISIVSNQ